MRQVNCNVLSASDATSQNGDQIDANQLISASFHAYFGDTSAAGSIKIQASNDVAPIQQAGTFVVSNWVDIPSATASVTSGGAVLITINQVCYRWMRAVFTQNSAGSTTVNVNMEALSM